MSVEYVIGDCREVLKTLPDKSINCCVTSPPYYGLRDYGHENQIGLERTPDEYVNELVHVFNEVKRVLRDDGTVFLNLGDSYASSTKSGNKVFGNAEFNRNRPSRVETKTPEKQIPAGLKPKDLLGIPWRVAFALQADGWYLRQDIIWCLSGGAIVYARTQKGDMPQMVKDLVRLDPKSVKLWNGEMWTQVVSWTENPRPEQPIQITLRSGERIGCTPGHYWPTQRGNVKASDLLVGDVIKTTTLPEPEYPECSEMLPDSIGWFVGMYLAEGSRSEDTIQISSHTREMERYERLCTIANQYGGSCFKWNKRKNSMTINLNGKILNAIIDTYIGGKIAKDKHLSMACWRRSNEFLKNLLRGYLDGDGHFDEANNRWRIGFTRNYYLESDIRTLCARLGYRLTLKPTISKIGDKEYPSFRGEIRFSKSGHWNDRDSGEIMAITKSNARHFWDIEVEDEPHLFALASGVLTHNSKPNPMPESVKDRCTKAHEYVFLLSKSGKYYFDAESIKTESKEPEDNRGERGHRKRFPTDKINGIRGAGTYPKANKRSVWNINTKPYKGAHFAVFPQELAEPCVLAGCPVGGTVLDPFGGSGTVGEVCRLHQRNAILIELNKEYEPLIQKRIGYDTPELVEYGGIV